MNDAISGDYFLEVSSPGIDRPLIKAADWKHFMGHDAEDKIKMPDKGRMYLRGMIKSYKDDELTLVDNEIGEVRLQNSNVDNAKLLLTEKLIKFSKNKI